MQVILEIVEIGYLAVQTLVMCYAVSLLRDEPKETPVEAIKKVLPKKKRRLTADEKKRQAEFQRTMDLARNVEVFDGTPRGQKEIK